MVVGVGDIEVSARVQGQRGGAGEEGVRSGSAIAAEGTAGTAGYRVDEAIARDQTDAAVSGISEVEIPGSIRGEIAGPVERGVDGFRHSGSGGGAAVREACRAAPGQDLKRSVGRNPGQLAGVSIVVAHGGVQVAGAIDCKGSNDGRQARPDLPQHAVGRDDEETGSVGDVDVPGVVCGKPAGADESILKRGDRTGGGRRDTRKARAGKSRHRAIGRDLPDAGGVSADENVSLRIDGEGRGHHRHRVGRKRSGPGRGWCVWATADGGDRTLRRNPPDLSPSADQHVACVIDGQGHGEDQATRAGLPRAVDLGQDSCRANAPNLLFTGQVERAIRCQRERTGRERDIRRQKR